jgi:hypothetical protein
LFLPVILERRAELAAAGFQWGVMEDEWEHGHTGDNYRPLVGLNRYDESDPGGEAGGGDEPGTDGAPDGGGAPDGADRPFLKLSGTVALESWAEAPELLTALFVSLLTILSGEDNSILSGEDNG